MLTCPCWRSLSEGHRGREDGSIPSLATALPHSSMVEQAAVNRKVVCTLREDLRLRSLLGQPFIAEWTTWKVAVTLNHGDAGSNPASASTVVNFGFSIGKISVLQVLSVLKFAIGLALNDFVGKYANRQSGLTLNQVFEGSIPSFPVGGHEMWPRHSLSSCLYSCSPIGRGGCLRSSPRVGSTPTRSTHKLL